MYWTHGWGKWSGRVGVRASAGNCGCKLSVHYSSIITARVLSCLMYCLCDYYTDADVPPDPDTHKQDFCGKRHSSTTVAKLKSKVCVLISYGSFMNDSFNASVTWKMKVTNHLCFLISLSHILRLHYNESLLWNMIKDCVWLVQGIWLLKI